MGIEEQLTALMGKYTELQAKVEQLEELLIEERIPNFCAEVECGCAERVKEAREKARVRLQKELKIELQALKGGE